MDAIGPEKARIAIEAGWDMRVGRKLKRTLYLLDPFERERVHLRQEGFEAPDICVGIVDTEAIASQIVALWNENAQQTRKRIKEEYGDG